MRAADSENPQRALPLLLIADLVHGKTVKYRRRRATVRQMQRSPATVERLATGRPREDLGVFAQRWIERMRQARFCQARRPARSAASVIWLFVLISALANL
jgi:hypothetical protein